MGRRIDVDWAHGGYLTFSAWCGRYTENDDDPLLRRIYPIDDVANQGTVEVPAGTKGFLLLVIKLDYSIFGAGSAKLGPETGSLSYKLKWTYTCTPEGVLTLKYDDPGPQVQSGYVAMSISAPDDYALDESKPTDPFWVKAGLSYADGGNGGVTVEYKGVSATVGGSPGKASSGSLAVRINFDITGKQPPKPPPTVKMGEFKKIIYFEYEGQDDLDKNAPGKGNTVMDLQNWVVGVRNNKELFEAVGKRYVPIELYGYASKTDGDAKNFDLSVKRIENVQRRLKGMLGNPFGQEIWFDPDAMGSREADQKDVPAAERDRTYLKDRRVEIWIDSVRAVDGIKSMRQGQAAPSSKPQ